MQGEKSTVQVKDPTTETKLLFGVPIGFLKAMV